MGRKGARCVVCGASVPLDHVRAEGRAGRMGAQMMAIVAEGKRGRIYLPPNDEHERIAASARPEWAPETELSTHPQYMGTPRYGLTRHRDLFTLRQLVALTTFSDLIRGNRELISHDIIIEPDSHFNKTHINLNKEYFNAIDTYLSFALNRVCERSTTICTWDSSPSKLQLRGTFARQAIPITWDYAEGNIFSDSSGTWASSVQWVCEAVGSLQMQSPGIVSQLSASNITKNGKKIFSTDPPYYDNVPYADLSDFFYIWLRAMLKNIYPELFETLLAPKAQELVADQFRHDGRDKAQKFFEENLFGVFEQIYTKQVNNYPITIYYAFKQREGEDNENKERELFISDTVSSTGWETMLEGLIRAGFTINGTWPMRTELSNRIRSLGSNALATSIVLVCRPRPEDARSTTRLEFIRLLRRELPEALRALQHANIAPVDLAQAAIGPGMAIYSRFKAVLEADGTPMRVRTALQLINQALDEVLAEQEGTYDADTRWAIAWFEQHAFDEGAYGIAETLSKAKNTSVQGMVEAGVVQARAGRVRLLRRDELLQSWNPTADTRLTAWEATQQLVHALDQRGEQSAAKLLAVLPGSLADTARDLAYRLYTTCERKKWAQEALCYNALVIAWPEISRQALALGQGRPGQTTMDL